MNISGFVLPHDMLFPIELGEVAWQYLGEKDKDYVSEFLTRIRDEYEASFPQKNVKLNKFIWEKVNE
jgi:hypothetical protein